MTEGPILPKLFRYSIPFIIVNCTQVLFNAIDIAILGNFANDDAVAAVGATSVLIFLLNAVAIGLSSGVNIIVARCVGGGDEIRARQTTGTALLTSAVASIGVSAAIFPFVPTILTWLNCDPLLLSDSSHYLRILLFSIPFQWIYNFLAAAIRATGNSSAPMRMMLIAGGCKVVCNFFLVGLLQMGVTGAGISTILTHAVAAGQALYAVSLNRSSFYTLERQNLRIRKHLLLDMVRFGVPASLSSTCLYIANAVIQSCLNSMGKAATTANAVSTQWDAFIYNVGAAVAIATMSFVSQNIGAGKFDRAKKTIGVAALLGAALSLSLGTVIAIFSDQLCGITTDSPEIIALAKERLILYCFTYFIDCVMCVVANSLISMGHTRNHLCVNIVVGVCFRIFWATTVWPHFRTIRALYTVVPLSDFICLMEFVPFLFFYALPKLKKRLEGENKPVISDSVSSS